MDKFTENDLVENKELRSAHLERIEVLENVGNLITLPDTELVTTKMVAQFYEVSQDVIRDNIRRHKEELSENGMKLTSYSEIKKILNSEDISHLKISRQGTNLFSIRAVLNIGMLLRDSITAKEVRNQILNGFELLTHEQKMSFINEEEELILNIARAGMDTLKLALAINELSNFHNRHKNKLNERIEEMEPKEEAFEMFINAEGYQNMKQASNSLGIGRNTLYNFLRKEKILTADNIPYQKYMSQDYFVVKQITINKGEFSSNKPQTYVTPKGINWISKLLKKI